jgi:predicted metalloprotease
VMVVPRRDIAATIRSRYGYGEARKIQRALRPECLSGIAKDKTFRIRRAEAILPADAGQFGFYDCAYEELLQGLGIINDDNSVPWSMFNDDVQTSWEAQFAQLGVPYRHAKLVLFTDATQTGCGYGDAATGPFYCPADERVYIDLGFFQALQDKLGARGQFAQAYVVAHELGHHVQNLLGISKKADGMRSAQGATSASVRLELQADCFAGIWAHSTQQRDLLEDGDIESAVGAAAAVGDDRLQRQATGTVSPDSWTHGSSEERVRWFRRGYNGGSIPACDTFSATQL